MESRHEERERFRSKPVEGRRKGFKPGSGGSPADFTQKRRGKGKIT